MITKKCLVVPLAAIAITFSSEIVFAVEKTNSGSSSLLWSLLALVAVLLIFGKQLLADAFPKSQETSSEEPAEEDISVTVPAEETQEKEQTEISVEKADDTKIKEVAEDVKTKSVDLKDGRKRCQAVTAKGTRCKRKINLENASITISGINYDLTICRQHKTTGFKPFPKLLK